MASISTVIIRLDRMKRAYDLHEAQAELANGIATIPTLKVA